MRVHVSITFSVDSDDCRNGSHPVRQAFDSDHDYAGGYADAVAEAISEAAVNAVRGVRPAANVAPDART